MSEVRVRWIAARPHPHIRWYGSTTLEEIRTIEGNPPSIEKAASPGFNQAEFIKTALDQGHSPENIALFLGKLLSAPAAQ